MGILETNLWWLLLLSIIAFIFVYKKLTKNPDAIASKFEAKKKINGNPTESLKFKEEALKNAGFKKIGLDIDENRFYALAKFSMWSFFEYIEVSFNHDHFSSDLKFKSICALPTQLFDWGKNKRNYKKFEKELEKLMPTSTISNAI